MMRSPYDISGREYRDLDYVILSQYDDASTSLYDVSSRKISQFGLCDNIAI